MSGCLCRKRWFCLSQTHNSCVQERSDGPPDRGQLPTVAEKWPKRTRNWLGIDDSGLGCVPRKTRGGGLLGPREVRPAHGSSSVPRFCLGQTHVSCVLGRCDLTRSPRPYLGLPRPNSLFVCPWKMRPHKGSSAVPRFCLGQTDISCVQATDWGPGGGVI